MKMENERLIHLRKEKGITQAQLAEAIGVTQAMIAYIEAGTKEPSKEFKIKLATYFNVTVEYLFYELYYNQQS